MAVDDEPPALALIRNFALKNPELNLCATFTDPMAAREYIRENRVDLLFLDIRMNDITGIEFLKSLPLRPMVIFTTAYKEYAFDGFEMNALDYLLKPFSQTRFQRAVAKALDSYGAGREDLRAPEEFLYITVDYKAKRLRLKDIYYFESRDNYVKIYTASASFLVLTPLSVIAERLPASEFIRIHRRYIVATDKLVFVQQGKVGLTNEVELPVGGTFRQTISAWKKHQAG